MTQISSETRHASSVAINGHAVLLTGPSGSGKSDLALRLIDRGAELICDDYTLIVRRGDSVWALPTPNIAGKLEIRGLGIVEQHHIAEASLRLIVRLTDLVERFPHALETEMMLGVPLPVVALSAFEASAPIKVERALDRVIMQ